MLNRFSGVCRVCLLIVSALVFLLLNVPSGFSADIKLAWDPNTEPDLAGYKVYYGTSPRTGTDPKNCGLCGYFFVVPVGNIVTYVASNLVGGQAYYFSVTASDLSQNESGFSNEVSGTAGVSAQPYTFATNPAGLQITVDGTTYTAPQTFNWSPNSSHTLSVASPQGGTGTRYLFSSWSDGGAQNHMITVPSSGTTYTANFSAQYSLTTLVSPLGVGAVSPSGVNWYNSGQSVSVSASPNGGYSFLSWAGDLTGSTNPASLTMSEPKSVTANFTQNQYTLAVSVNPSGSGSVTKSPSKSTYVYGEQVTLTATANAGYSFGSWSGDASGTTSPTTVTINGNKTVSATFTAIPETVSTPTTPTGSGTGVTGTSYSYSTGGATSNLSHSMEYQFDWKGDGSDLSAWGGANQSKTWVTGGAYQVKARARCMSDTGVVSGWSSGLSVSISQATVSCTFATTPTGLQVTVDGTTYTTPQTFGWVPGSSHTVSISSPQSGGAGTQYVYSSWSDGGAQNHMITVPSSSTTYTANIMTQYSLTTAVSPSGVGTVSPSGVNWYNSGQSVSVSASPNGGYSFLSWVGDLTGSTNPASLTMGGPKSVTANFGSSGSLVVTPSTGLTASGTQGGPFNPSSQNYFLENKGAVAIGWSALKTQNWIGLSLTGGILGPGATATVTVSINSNANGLAVGSFGDTITFENTTNGSGNTSRVVGLTVNAAPQTYTVSSNVSGLQVYVDDTAYSTSQSFQWVPGSSHKLYAPSPQKPTQTSRYNFQSWSDSGAQTHTINAPGTGTTYVAKYKTQNKIKVTVSPSGAGTVSLSGSKQSQSGATSIVLSTEDWYDDDDTVTLTASPASGYTFLDWAGDLSGKDNPAKTQTNKPKDVVANFVAATETVSTPNLPSGPGNGAPGTSYSFATGGAASSLAHAVEYQFDWKGDGTDLSPWGAATQSKTWATAGACQVKARARCVTDTTVVSNWSGGLSVVMTQSGVSCTVATNPSGLQITVDGSNYTAPQVFTWTPGSSHTVSAATTLSGGPGIQYAYLSWSDGGGQSHTVTVPPSNTTYTANFTAQYSLTTSVAPSGAGTVSPSGVNWHNSGQNVPMSASAGAGYSFSGWTGDLSGAANPTSLTMSGPKSVTANFSALSANLVVTPVTGLSASGPQGGPFSPASQVFTVQNSGGTGSNWSVSKSQDWLSLSSSGGALAPGMSASLTVAFNASANTLAPGTYTDAITFKDQGGGNTIGIRSVALVVSSAQSGYTVTSDPPGLFVIVDGMTCRAPCTFDWPSGSSHALSVSPLPQPGFSGTQYVFGRWNDGGSQSHVITASLSTRTYLASFDTQYSLTLFASPVEGGKTSPSGITWFNAGERVSLSAAPNEGYSFAGWSGDVSGNQSPTTFLMDKAKLVTANFSAGTSLLTANAVPPTSGSISKSPDKVTYTTGEQVTLTAIPNPGCAFKNWSGDLGGETSPVTLTVKGNMTVAANFVSVASFDVTPLDDLNISGRQGGTFNPASQTYTLQNRSGKLLKWKVLKKPKWLTAAPTSGTLAPGEETQVVVSIGSTGKQLKPGSYRDAIVVGNTANKADSLSRAVTLTVQPALKTYSVKTNPDGLQAKVDGVAYAAPQVFEWEAGSSHQLEVSSPQGGAPGMQYVFSSWNNGKSQNQTIVAPAKGGTFTATFKVQYGLTMGVGPAGGGTVVPSGAVWFDQGQKITVKAIPNDGFQFLNWSGDLSGSNNPVNLNAGKPANIVANFIETKGKGTSEMSGTPDSSKNLLPLIGSLESPSGGKRVLGLKTIYGWALDGERIARVKLHIDGEFVCDIPYGGLTEGLREVYPNYPDAERGGFALVWNYSDLSPGVHLVQIEVQNARGDVLNLGANVVVQKIPGETVNQANPTNLLIPGVNLTVDGKTNAYDLRLEWSKESQAFEIIDLYPR